MITRFFLLTFAMSWLVQLPGVLATVGVIPGPAEKYMNLVGLGLLGPMSAALILSRFEPGGTGAGALLRSIFGMRVRPLWIVLALTLPALGFLLSRGLYALSGHDGGPWLYPPQNPQRWVALVIAPVGEEIGWRGFALPRMQRRMSRLSAALLLGVLWGLWHLMMNIVAGVSLTMNLASILMLIPGSLIFSWLYNRSGGSLLIAILLHMGVHLNNPNQVLPGNSLPFYINIVGMTLLGLLVLADRAAWRNESDPEPAA